MSAKVRTRNGSLSLKKLKVCVITCIFLFNKHWSAASPAVLSHFIFHEIHQSEFFQILFKIHLEFL